MARKKKDEVIQEEEVLVVPERKLLVTFQYKQDDYSRMVEARSTVINESDLEEFNKDHNITFIWRIV